VIVAVGHIALFSHAHATLVSIEYHYAAARHSDHLDPSEQRQTVRIHHADDHGAGERLARRAADFQHAAARHLEELLFRGAVLALNEGADCRLRDASPL